jgi:hypothetical protein
MSRDKGFDDPEKRGDEGAAWLVVSRCNQFGDHTRDKPDDDCSDDAHVPRLRLRPKNIVSLGS